MYSSGQNASDPECFQSCNNEWRREFEENFKVNCTDFYDFPFHPKILQYAEYLKYCEIAEKQTKCFLEKCEDQSADRVFSPSNFLCHFKRTQFLSARPCLEDTEPITFLKCDEFCHKKAVEEVFINGELDKYENELSLLCSFQECYRECHRPIIEEVCSSTLADASIDLIQAYVQWHATDIYDWHILSENIDKLPASCARLTGYKPEEDPVLDIMNSIT
uniref:Uncharacterized protein n=1 Tax=Acrobeloides nanus TaxID=290746 RepID=A0A914EKS1_9BILA